MWENFFLVFHLTSEHLGEIYLFEYGLYIKKTLSVFIIESKKQNSNTSLKHNLIILKKVQERYKNIRLF